MRLMLIIIFFCVVSCSQPDGVEFTIHNESNDIIDSVIVSSSDKRATLKLTDIKEGISKSSFLNMQETAKVDGDYLIEIYTQKDAFTHRIGYYTNGSPIDKKIDVYFLDNGLKYQTIRKTIKK